MELTIDPANNKTLISKDNNILSLPRGEWGSPDVTFNGNQIPSAKIWKLIASYMVENAEPDLENLFNEAKIANIFRQLEIGMIVWTLNPKKTDMSIQDNVYVRKEKQRIRYLANKFEVKIAKIEGSFDPDTILEVHKACLTVGLHPVGCVDERLYYCRSPEKVFRAFGSSDWLRIGVFLKRPSSSSFSLSI